MSAEKSRHAVFKCIYCMLGSNQSARDSIHFLMELSEASLSSLPSFQLISGYCFFSCATLWLIVLPPEVAKGITVLPLRLFCSINVLTAVGARSHQIGYPMKMTSYFFAMSTGEGFTAGREEGLFISTELREFLSFQSRSASV